MRTIREVWVENLNNLIGEKSKKVVSAESGIPYSTLFNMLKGHIADGANLTKIAEYFGVPETHLFVDFEEFGPKKKPTAQEALAVLAEALATQPQAAPLPEAQDFDAEEMAMLREAALAIRESRSIGQTRKKREQQS